jgi:uncharacterized damage-inducible protein DinB
MIANLGKYYEWADNRIIALLAPLDEELFEEKMKGTKRSLRDLSEHLVVYYEYFLRRKEKVSFKSLQEKLKKMDKKALLNHWKNIINEFSETVETSEEDFVDIPLSKGKSAKISSDEYLFCYSDHASYHRGQLITTYKVITRQKATATDYYDFLNDNLKNG